MTDAAAVRRKLRTTVSTLGERYFVDRATRTVGGTAVDHWNLVLGSLTYLSKRNMLLVGEPGTGKTTFANAVAAALSGLPFDAFARTQIQGHPDQTKEEMLARAHVGKLTTQGTETVVWQHTLFLPAVLVDEFNRLPEGKQSILQEVIRTGAVSHLNETFDRGDLPFAATVNEDSQGTYDVTQPNLDRFDVSMEFTHGNGWAQRHVEAAARRIEDDLAMSAAATDLLTRLGTDDQDPDAMLETVAETRRALHGRFEDLGLDPFTPAEEATFREAVDDVSLTPDAQSFVAFLYDECNLSSTLTHKRRSDDPDRLTHDRDLAYSRLVTGVSARRRRAIEGYSRMLAFYLGDEAATRDHVRAVAPHCLAHAVEFTADFRAEHAEDRRAYGERAEAHLARTLVADVEENYDDLAETIKLLSKAARDGDLTEDERATVDRLVAGDPEPDHPHLTVWAEQLRARDDGP